MHNAPVCAAGTRSLTGKVAEPWRHSASPSRISVLAVSGELLSAEPCRSASDRPRSGLLVCNFWPIAPSRSPGDSWVNSSDRESCRFLSGVKRGAVSGEHDGKEGAKITRNLTTAIAAGTALIEGGVSISPTYAASENSTEGAARVGKAVPTAAVQPPVAPAVTETDASAATPALAPSPNGNSGGVDGIPFYDANSDPTLIQYPADWAEDELANVRVWVETMTITAK